MDMIENTNKVVEDARNQAIVTVQKYTTPKKISAFFEMLISVACLIGIKLIELGFDFNELLKLSNWISIACSTLGIFILYRAVINSRFDQTAMRESVVQARNKYNELSAKKDLSLKDFLIEFNLKTKISVYIAKMNRKLAKAEKKRLKALRPRRIIKLDNKIESIKALMTTEYIKANIDKMRIKYYIVYYSDFCTESTPYDRDKLNTRSRYDKEFNKASFKKMWMYIMSSALTIISVASMNIHNKTTLITSIAATIVMIVTRVVTALLEADKLYDRTVTSSFIDRSMILEEYLVWKSSHPSAMEQHDKELEDRLRIEYEEKSKVLIEQALTKALK